MSSASQNIENKRLNIEQNYNCDELIEMSEKEKEKIKLMSEQQALKEAEISLRAKIEKDEAIKFCDYKKVMKVLYDKMFDNQSELLRHSK